MAFLKYGRALMERGYLITPIAPRSKKPQLKKWPDVRLRESDLEKYQNHGIGILCGQGQYPLAGMDIDSTHAELVREYRNWCNTNLGVAPERVGREPKTLLLFRASKAGWSKRTSKAFKDEHGNIHRLEILCNRQQFVAYGIHPDTGKPYEWLPPLGDLTTINAADLPELADEMAQQSILQFEELAQAHGLTPAEGSTGTATVDDDPFNSTPRNDMTIGEARALLCHLNSSARYGYWINVGMALHFEFHGSDKALNLWNEWSSTGSNYKDFSDLQYHWGTFKADGASMVTANWFRSEARTQKKLAAAFSNPPQEIASSLPDAPVFDPALLPGALGDFVMDEADRMNCAPDYIAAALMVALGSVIGARCALKPKRRDVWVVPPNLYGGIVGEPSSKKSPAAGAAIRFLNLLEAREAQAHEEAMLAHGAHMAAFEAQKAAIKYSMAESAKKKKSKEHMNVAIAEMQALTPPQEPVQRRFITNDSTVAKLGDLLAHNPQGLLVFRDELVGLLASWDKEGNEGDRAFYLEAWNGGDGRNIDRIVRGSQHIPLLLLSVFGGIQPELLERYLSEMANSLDNDGRFQRFQMLVFPDPVPWEHVDRYPNKEARDYVKSLFERLAYADFLECGAQPANDLVRLPYFQLDDAALDVFVQWCKELNTVLIAGEDNPLMKQHYGKYEKLFCAIALILHLAAGKTGDVDQHTAQMAVAWCEYLAKHAMRIYGLLETYKVKTAKAIGKHIRQGKLPDHFTARDVQRKQWSGLITVLQVEAALDILESFGWVASYQDGGIERGRPTTRYAVHPSLQVIKK